MSFRKEKKYRLSWSDQKLLKALLADKGMKPLYPSRLINSIYFDTKKYKFFYDSEEGLLPRTKVRLRWYENNLSSVTKETKISSVEGRFKISEDFLGGNFDPENDIKIFDQESGNLYPVVLISYSREYYLLDGLRVTFDLDIRYSSFKSIIKSSVIDDECVMEVKVSNEMPDDYIESIIEHPISRYSKYSRAMLKTFYLG